MDKTTYVNINGHYYERAFLERVMVELKNKIPLWKSEIESPTDTERFVFDVLKDINL